MAAWDAALVLVCSCLGLREQLCGSVSLFLLQEI